jgi:hypothetical protein
LKNSFWEVQRDQDGQLYLVSVDGTINIKVSVDQLRNLKSVIDGVEKGLSW